MIDYTVKVIQSKKYNQLIPLNDEINKFISKSEIVNGLFIVNTKHTTTGIIVNEKLECLEDDILDILQRMVPEDDSYYHARFLRSYGAMAGNPTGHLKSLLAGSYFACPYIDSKLMLGHAQQIYLAEFDGPQPRSITFFLIGDVGNR